MERHGVQADLALLDDALVVLEDVFDGVFERDDVLFEVGVDVFDHRGEGGGFAGARGAGHQHNAAGDLAMFSHLVQQPQFVEARHVGFDVAHRQAPCGRNLLEEVGAEASMPGRK